MAGEWSIVPLEVLIEPNRGISYGIVQPGASVLNGVPIVRVSDIRDGRIATENPLRVSPVIEAAYTRTRLKGGELLLTLVGTVGETAVVPESLAGWNTARAVAVIPVSKEVSSYWVRLALHAPAVQQIIDSRLNTTVQATLNLRDVAQLPIILPPPRERDAIAHILGTLDDKIELNRRMSETLEAMARAIFKSWFVDFDPVRAKARGEQPAGLAPHIAALFPDKLVETELGKVPGGWEIGSFLELADLLSGGTPSTSEQEYWNGDIPWVSAKDVSGAKGSFLLKTEKTITRLGLQNSSTKILPAHTTIITARGTVGSYCLLGAEMAMNQTNYGLRARNGTADYFIFFSTAQMIDHWRQQAYGTIFDTITTKTFRDTVIVRPPEPLLGEFEAMAGPIMMRVLANERQSNTLAALRDTLLPKLISGELRVTDA